MSGCTQADFDRSDFDPYPEELTVFNTVVSASDGRILVMLDAPETINVTATDTNFFSAQNTYLMEVPVPAATLRKFRLYFWHKAGDNDYELKIFAKLTTGGTASLSGIKLLAISEASDLAAMGRCLAKAHLYGTIPDGGSAITLSGTESLIYSSSIAEGVTLGGVMEFNVAGFLGSAVDLPVAAHRHSRLSSRSPTQFLPRGHNEKLFSSLRPIVGSACGGYPRC